MDPEAPVLTWPSVEMAAVEDDALSHAEKSAASAGGLTILAVRVDDVKVDMVVSSGRSDTTVAAPRACFTTLVRASWTAR